MTAYTRWSVVVATCAVIAGLFGVTGTSVASAAPTATPGVGVGNSSLLRATPRDGGVLYAAPVRVTLSFRTPIRALGATVTVRDSAGRSWRVGAPTITGSKLVQRTNLYAGEGRYEIRYRVFAADGHRITGVIHYRVKSV